MTIKPGKAGFLLFSGFDATSEDLGITSTNLWLFKSNDMDTMLVTNKLFYSETMAIFLLNGESLIML